MRDGRSMTRKNVLTPAPIEEVLPEDRIETTYVRIDDLKPYENNPRFNDDTVPLLINSIESFGFKVPPVVMRDGTLITGHTRIKAAKEAGRKAIACIIAEDFDDAKSKMFRLADNKTQEVSSWDFDKLPFELDGVKDMGYEPEDFGFTPLDLGAFDDEDADEDGDEGMVAPPTNMDMLEESEFISTSVRPGDVIAMGKAEVVCAPVELDDVMELQKRKTSRLHEPDPEKCEALARGWMEETGRRPVLMREGSPVDGFLED